MNMEQQWDWAEWRASSAMLSPMTRLVMLDVAALIMSIPGRSGMNLTVMEVARVSGIPSADVIKCVIEMSSRMDGCVITASSQNHRDVISDETIIQFSIPKLVKAEERRRKNAASAARHRKVISESVARHQKRDEEKNEESERASEKERTKGKGKEKVKEEIKEEEKLQTNKAPAQAGTRVREYADEEPRPLTGGGRVVIATPISTKQVMDAAAVQGIAIKEEDAVRFMDFWEARGWLDKNNRPFSDWRRLLREYKVFIDRESRQNGNNGIRNTGGPSRFGDPRNKPEDFDADWLKFNAPRLAGGKGAGEAGEVAQRGGACG